MSRFALWLWLVVYAAIGMLCDVDPRLLCVAVASAGAAFLLHWLANRDAEFTDRYL